MFGGARLGRGGRSAGEGGGRKRRGGPEPGRGGGRVTDSPRRERKLAAAKPRRKGSVPSALSLLRSPHFEPETEPWTPQPLRPGSPGTGRESREECGQAGPRDSLHLCHPRRDPSAWFLGLEVAMSKDSGQRRPVTVRAGEFGASLEREDTLTALREAAVPGSGQGSVRLGAGYTPGPAARRRQLPQGCSRFALEKCTPDQGPGEARPPARQTG